MAIIKGELQGDEYLWDVEYFEPRAKRMITGGWRSRIEDLKKPRGRTGSENGERDQPR